MFSLHGARRISLVHPPLQTQKRGLYRGPVKNLSSANFDAWDFFLLNPRVAGPATNRKAGQQFLFIKESGLKRRVLRLVFGLRLQARRCCCLSFVAHEIIIVATKRKREFLKAPPPPLGLENRLDFHHSTEGFLIL